MSRNNFPKIHSAKPRGVALVAIFFLLLSVWILGRLFYLQIVKGEFYASAAAENQEIYQKLRPARGAIYFTDARTGEIYPAAVNRPLYTVFAEPRRIKPEDVPAIASRLATLLELDNTGADALEEKLRKSASAYEVLAKKVPEETMDSIRDAALAGIGGDSDTYRFYPEETSGAQTLGFAKPNDQGVLIGEYGIEGFWNKNLTGSGGYFSGAQGATGNWITVADRSVLPAEPGDDLVLTIDRALQYKVCERLRQGFIEYAAKGASLVLMDPNSGAILALCSLPDYDINHFSEVRNVGDFNNTAIFTAYEPGSVFKPITMAGALNEGAVAPNTAYTDPCTRKIDKFTIRNAEGRCWGRRTMTEVLQKSINTGMIFVEEKLGIEKFREYVKKFGFGVRTGIDVNFESAGNIASLEKNSPVYGAVAAFGQGLTATPVQLATAYSAIANQGKMFRPHVVKEIRHFDGLKEIVKPELVEEVLSPRTASLLTGMLVAVIDNYGKAARVPGFYVAGKTGTAQIAGKGGYQADLTNQTFAGFAPANNPKFVLIVKYEQPNTPWAELSAGPVFSDVMKFALEYYGIPKER